MRIFQRSKFCYVGVIACIALAAFASTQLHAQTPTILAFESLGYRLADFQTETQKGLVIADFDGDGIDDLAIVGFAENPAIFVIGKRSDGIIDFKQIVMIPSNSVATHFLGAAIGGSEHAIAILQDGTVLDYAGWPLVRQNTFSTAPDASAAAIGDLYGTGQEVLVVLANNRVLGFDLATGSLLWTTDAPGATDMILAQLGTDPALKIVLNSGLTLDAATRVIDAQYSGGFGNYLVLGHVSGTTGTQLLAIKNGVSVYGGPPWQFLWNTDDIPIGVEAIGTADIDGNGRDVILAGDSQGGPLRVFDPVTRQQRFEIANPGYGINSVAVLDMTGTSAPDLAFSSDTGGVGGASVSVIDARTGSAVWSFAPQQNAEFTTVAIADADGNGTDELIAASSLETSPPPIGNVQILGFDDGSLQWYPAMSGAPPFSASYQTTQRILVLPHQNDAAKDIVFAGSQTYSGSVIAIDGVTHATRWSDYQYSTGPFNNFSINDAVALDVVGDGTLDIAVAMQPNNPTIAPQIDLLSHADGHVVWFTTDLGAGGSTSINNLLFVPASTSHAQGELVVAFADRLALIDVQTHAFDRSITAAGDGATYIASGAAGAEFVVFEHNGVANFYDASTGDLLRTLSFAAPLNAIQPLDGDIAQLVVASGNGIALADGLIGSVVANSGFLGSEIGLGNQLAIASAGAQGWKIGAGGSFGIVRFLLHPVPDEIFTNGFE